MENKFLTLGEFCKALRICNATAWRWITDGKLHVIRLGKKKTLVARAEVERLLGNGGQSHD